jgi:hypothetical protein
MGDYKLLGRHSEFYVIRFKFFLKLTCPAGGHASAEACPADIRMGICDMWKREVIQFARFKKAW